MIFKNLLQAAVKAPITHRYCLSPTMMGKKIPKMWNLELILSGLVFKMFQIFRKIEGCVFGMVLNKLNQTIIYYVESKI